MQTKAKWQRRAAATALFACFGAAGSAQAQPTQPVDVLIQGGTIYDGTEGNKGTIGDVAISGDRIVYVGPRAHVTAKRTIDAKGKIVSPGFIDGHTHPDHFLNATEPALRQVPAWLMQGASSIVIGVDGGGAPEIKQTFDKASSQGVGVNLIAFVGYAPIRKRVIGEDARAPTAAELLAEKELVAKGMCEGATGFSTGLWYTPQFYAKTDEIIDLAKEAGKRGGVYDTHQRDEGDYSIGLAASVKEALEIGKQAGTPVHIAHIKAIGPDLWGKAPDVVKQIDQARSNGQIVTVDQYPYPSGMGPLQAILMPPWAMAGGYAAMIKRFNDPPTLAKIEVEATENLRRMSGPHSILFTLYNQPWTGKRLDELAKEWKVTPIDATIRVLRQSELQRVAAFFQSQGDMDVFMKQSWTSTGSDGGEGHPRQYATFPDKYTGYVKNRHVISMGDFIRSSTGLPAEIYMLDHRGTLKVGNYADVLVFDPDKYVAKADYLHWDRLAEGVNDLLINGKFAVDNGKMTMVLSGRPLPHTPTKGSCL